MDTRRPGRVVVGVDDTLSGLQALRRAVAEARSRGVPVHVVRAWSPAPPTWYPYLQNQRQDEAAGASQVVARAFTDTMGGLPTDVEVQAVLVPDAPGPALLRYASQDDDLLILGTVRRGLWRRLSRRSVVHYCLARAACPVLVIPPPPLSRVGSQRALLRQLRRELDHFAGDGSAGPEQPGRPAMITTIDLASAVDAAVRAPSLHNSQPWRFRFHEGAIEVRMDSRRTLPAADPSGWAARLAIGAAMFNLLVEFV